MHVSLSACTYPVVKDNHSALRRFKSMKEDVFQRNATMCFYKYGSLCSVCQAILQLSSCLLFFCSRSIKL